MSGMELFLDHMEFEISRFKGDRIDELYEILKKHAMRYKSDLQEYEQMIKVISERLGI